MTLSQAFKLGVQAASMPSSTARQSRQNTTSSSLRSMPAGSKVITMLVTLHNNSLWASTLRTTTCTRLWMSRPRRSTKFTCQVQRAAWAHLTLRTAFLNPVTTLHSGFCGSRRFRTLRASMPVTSLCRLSPRSVNRYR
jgi:hypothetical protein